MRTALVEWSVASPRIDAMINATQSFASRAFTAPKVFLLSWVTLQPLPVW